jgi:hypothetical protein
LKHSIVSWSAVGLVLLSAACGKDTPTPPPPPPPDSVDITLTLSADTVRFADTIGSAVSPIATVNITAADSVALAGLDVSIGTVTYVDATGGWLTYTLDRETTPAVLTLQPSILGLSAGTYTATVPVVVDTAVNSPKNIRVILTLAPQPPVPPDPPPTEPRPSPIPGVVVALSGNNAKCGSSLSNNSFSVIDTIIRPNYLIVLGDNVYPNDSANAGRDVTLADFMECYDPLWGRFKSITYAAVGGREQDSLGVSAGADAYFGLERAGPVGDNYYSFNIGSWHVIVLNILSGGRTNPNPYDAESAQYKWLEQDLEANQGTRCIMAVWHDGMFYSSNNHPTPTDSNIGIRRQPQRGIWNLLYHYGADLVINGGDHIYERFGLMRYWDDQKEGGQEFRADSVYGIRQISAGLGGDGPVANPRFEYRHPMSQYRSGGNGVLKLQLGEGQYTWEFINTKFSNVQDWGTGTCHDRPPR